MGQHHMDICGEGRAVERGHLLRLAAEGGVAIKAADVLIDQMLALSHAFVPRAMQLPIRRATVRQMSAVIDRCRKRLARA